MIVTVRIAPIERWCKVARNVKGTTLEAAARIVGMSVDIYTESCAPHWKHGDDARTWVITNESRDRIFAAAGRNDVPSKMYRFCEHMLEMD